MLGVPFRGPKVNPYETHNGWYGWDYMGYHSNGPIGIEPAPSTNWMQPDELAGHFEPVGQDPQIQIVKTWTRPSGVKSRNLLIGDFNF